MYPCFNDTRSNRGGSASPYGANSRSSNATTTLGQHWRPLGMLPTCTTTPAELFLSVPAPFPSALPLSCWPRLSCWPSLLPLCARPSAPPCAAPCLTSPCLTSPCECVLSGASAHSVSAVVVRSSTPVSTLEQKFVSLFVFVFVLALEYMPRPMSSPLSPASNHCEIPLPACVCV
jgi:hypothetical protein